MKRILCSLLVATRPFGSVLADAPKEKNAKVTIVYQHELPNVPGKSIKGVLVEYGPGGYSPGHTHAKSAFIYATVLKGGDPQSGQRRTGDDLQGRTELLRAARRPPRRQRQCQRDEAGQAPRGVRGGHERDGTDDPIRELKGVSRQSGAVRTRSRSGTSKAVRLHLVRERSAAEAKLPCGLGLIPTRVAQRGLDQRPLERVDTRL